MALRASLLMLCFFAASAAAQTRMTVADVESLLSSHIRQDDLAARLTSIELTQRVTPARVARWQARLKDSKARSALQAIADLSAFLPLPTSDIPSVPPPDKPTQDAIMSRATSYVAAILPHLPDFSAVRLTTRFEFATRGDLEREQSALQVAQMSRAKLGYKPLARLSDRFYVFLVGASRVEVTYRKGTEIATPVPEDNQRLRLSDPGLISSGEFGAILGIVDRDAVAGDIAWDHWEQGPAGLLAVYRYAVPKNKSHFVVYTPPVLIGMRPEKHTPAYHGEIAIDPKDGAIYRITVQAETVHGDVKPPVAGLLSGVAVDYAPTEIGRRMYVCPAHSVAIMTLQGGDQSAPHIRKFVNDTAFTGYHVFRTETRIVPDDPKAP